MAVQLASAIRFISQDGSIVDQLHADIELLKSDQQEAILSVLDMYLTQQIIDADGFIRPDLLTDDMLADLERDLLSFYDADNMQEYHDAVMGRFNHRLDTIDDLMQQLDLPQGILGDQVYELDDVLEETNRIARAFTAARDGYQGEEGAVELIQNALLEYRLKADQNINVARDELFNTLRKHSNILPNAVSSVARSALAAVDRKLRRKQSEDSGEELAKYVGPDDDLTRPFCSLHLNNVQPWRFWDELANDMPAGLFDFPVSTYGGGINCRHRLVVWLREWLTAEEEQKLTKQDEVTDDAAAHAARMKDHAAVQEKSMIDSLVNFLSEERSSIDSNLNAGRSVSNKNAKTFDDVMSFMTSAPRFDGQTRYSETATSKTQYDQILSMFQDDMITFRSFVESNLADVQLDAVPQQFQVDIFLESDQHHDVGSAVGQQQKFMIKPNASFVISRVLMISDTYTQIYIRQIN